MQSQFKLFILEELLDLGCNGNWNEAPNKMIAGHIYNIRTKIRKKIKSAVYRNKIKGLTPLLNNSKTAQQYFICKQEQSGLIKTFLPSRCNEAWPVQFNTLNQETGLKCTNLYISWQYCNHVWSLMFYYGNKIVSNSLQT